jgi:hypothetical protein
MRPTPPPPPRPYPHTTSQQVAPTFHLYRGREKLGEMTGAKMDKLKEMIEANL